MGLHLRTLIIILLLPIGLFSQEVFDSLFFKSSSSVYFKSDDFSLDNVAQSTLNNFISIDLKLDSMVIKISAHTDNEGGGDYNLRLSEQRANAVAEYLKSTLPNNCSMLVDYFGEEQPQNANLTDEEKSINRRVELRLYESKQLTWLTGKVVDNENSNPIENAKVRLHSLSHQDSSYTDQRGNFKVSAPIDQGVGLDIIAVGQMPQLIFKKLSSTAPARPLIIKTEKIEVGKKFTLRLLYFKGNQAILMPKSYKALPTLKDFMVSNRGTCIRIEGHINYPNKPDVKRDSWNFHLSSARAKTLYDYLHLEAGIDSSRMHFLGFGNWRMEFPKAFLASEQQKNRRVEIIIASCEETAQAVNDTISAKYNFGNPFRN